MVRRTAAIRILTVVFSVMGILSIFLASKDLNTVNSAGICDFFGCYGGSKKCIKIGPVTCFTC